MHKNIRVLARGLLSFSFFALAILPMASQAQTASAITNGVSWLSGEVQANGSLQNEAQSIATPLQARSEVFLTLIFLEL